MSEQNKVVVVGTEELRKLIEELLPPISEKEGKIWLREDEVMEILGIRSKSHMWKIRTTNPEIQVSQPSRKIILINRQSLMDWLEKKSV